MDSESKATYYRIEGYRNLHDAALLNICLHFESTATARILTFVFLLRFQHLDLQLTPTIYHTIPVRITVPLN